MKTSKQVLKSKMNVKYCSGTRYSYLDIEERELIESAMEEYADQFKSELEAVNNENEKLSERVKFWNDKLDASYNENKELKSQAEKSELKCDICGCHPSVIIRSDKGTHCQAHYNQLNNIVQ